MRSVGVGLILSFKEPYLGIEQVDSDWKQSRDRMKFGLLEVESSRSCRKKSWQKLRSRHHQVATCFNRITFAAPSHPSQLLTPSNFEMASPAVLNTISRWAVPVFVAVAVGQAAMYDVRGGNRAVIFDRLAGVKEGVVNEGTHFLIPWVQKAIIYDVRTKPRNISTTTGSKDLQMVSLTLRVLHRPEVQRLPMIYQV